jgi:hypothetical protein
VIDEIRNSLVKVYTKQLVDELLEAYQEAKRNYFLGGHRLNAVEGGRFCQAAYRMLEERLTGRFTVLGKQIDTERIAGDLANAPVGTQPESIRLHIPRSLRVVYDIRNKRDAAHLADGVDPNVQDATLVVSVLDWVLAEFIRLDHGVSADAAQRIVNNLVTRLAPVIEEFGNSLKVLDPDLSSGEHCLVILYQRGAQGATFEELSMFARPEMRGNLKRTLRRLVDDRAFVHDDSHRYRITRAGMRHVEEAHLLDPG